MKKFDEIIATKLGQLTEETGVYGQGTQARWPQP